MPHSPSELLTRLQANEGDRVKRIVAEIDRRMLDTYKGGSWQHPVCDRLPERVKAAVAAVYQAHGWTVTHRSTSSAERNETVETTTFTFEPK